MQQVYYWGPLCILWGGSATIVHAGTNVSGDVPQTGTTKADVQVEPASGQTGEENGSTEVKDPVKVAKDPTKDDTDVNQAIDDYANQKQKEQDEAGNKVVIRPSGKQPEKAADNATDRGTKVEDIKDSIDDGIAAANNDKAAIEDYKNKHQNQQILQGEESGAFKNQGLSVDDEKGSEIKNITITDKDKKTVYTYTPAIDGPSHNIEIDGKKDAIVITHTNNKTDKETNTMKINSDNKVIVDFQHDQCQGKEITVTYDNLKNSYYLENIDNKTNKIKISKIERTFLGIHAGDTIFTSDGHTPTSDGVYDKCYGPQLIIYNDPYDGFFYNNIKQVSVKDIYYDDKGNPITFKDGDKNKAWIFVTSLNSDGVGNNNHRGDGKEYLEKVKAENPDDTPAEMKKIAGSTVTGPVDENTTKDFTRTVELVDGHSNGDYLRNYLRTNADDLKKQGWIWQENSSELTQTVTLHVKKTNDGYVYDNADAFFKGLTLPPISENGTEKYPDIEIPEVRVGTKTAVRIRVSYSANSSTQKPLDKPEVDVDEEEVPDTHDGWWYSDESNSPQNNYPDWDNKSEDNRYAFVGAVAIQYQPGMTITYGADDTAWGSHWACTQTQVVSSLNERVIIYNHIKDGIIPVTPDNPGDPGKPIDPPIDPKDPDPKRPVWPKGTDKDSLSKDVTEYITYTGLPATETKVTHVLHFTGSGYLDKVTGKWTDKDGNDLEDQSLDKALEWTAQEGNHFDAVASPSKAGYYVDRVDVKVGDQQLDKDTDEYSAYTDGKDVKAVENITHNHENIVITVIYAPYQKAGLTIIDEDDIRAAEPNGHKLGSYSDTGKSGKDIAFTGAQAAVDAYLKAGYIWDSAKTKATDGTKADNYEGLKLGKLDKDASKDQNWTIYLKHGTTTFDPDKPNQPKPGAKLNPDDPNQDGPKVTEDMVDDKKQVTSTINYIVSDSKSNPAAPAAPTKNVQTATWKRTITVDNVTGKIISSTDWKTSDNYTNVDTPDLVGYYADKSSVPAPEVTQENVTTEVTYYPYQKAGLTIIDEDDIRAAEPNGHKLGSYSDTGKSGKDIAFTGAQAAVDAYLKAGYIWDSAKTKATDGTKADNYEGLKLGKLDKDASKDQNWTIYLKHGKVTVTPKNPGKPGEPINPNGPKWPAGTDANSLTKTGTQTIHYVGASDKTPADNTQTYTFIKSMVIDKVTGKVLDLGSWNIDRYTFGTVKTPVIPGYHADKAVAGGATVTPDDLDKVITVTYIPDGNPGNSGDQGDTPTPEPTPEPEPTPRPTPDDQPDSELSSDGHFGNVKAKNKLDKTNPKKVDAYKKETKIIKTKIAKQGHTEIAEPIEDKVTRENNVKVVSDPVENKAVEPKLPQTGEADNSIIGLLGMLLASFAAIFGFDSLHSHDKKHKN